MKAIIQCYTPQECDRIANGEQTVKVCKTAPKEVPFKVYIYCTKKGRPLVYAEPNAYFTEPILHRTFGYNKEEADKIWGIYNGKVAGEYICDKVIKYDYQTIACAKYEINGADVKEELRYNAGACLTAEEMYCRANGKDLRGLHISELKIYDEPRELREFFVIDKEAIKKCEFRSRVWQNPDFIEGGMILGGCVCDESEDWCTNCKIKPITRPPQSWCYVENS